MCVFGGGYRKRCHSAASATKNQCIRKPTRRTRTRSRVLTSCSWFLCGKYNYLAAAGVINKLYSIGNGSKWWCVCVCNEHSAKSLFLSVVHTDWSHSCSSADDFPKCAASLLCNNNYRTTPGRLDRHRCTVAAVQWEQRGAESWACSAPWLDVIPVLGKIAWWTHCKSGSKIQDCFQLVVVGIRFWLFLLGD